MSFCPFVPRCHPFFPSSFQKNQRPSPYDSFCLLGTIQDQGAIPLSLRQALSGHVLVLATSEPIERKCSASLFTSYLPFLVRLSSSTGKFPPQIASFLRTAFFEYFSNLRVHSPDVFFCAVWIFFCDPLFLPPSRATFLAEDLTLLSFPFAVYSRRLPISC